MKRWCLVLIFLVAGCSFVRSEFYRDQADFLYEQATRAYSEKRFDEAKEMYQKIISLDPAYPEAYVGLGHCAMIKGQGQEALAHYEKALALNPTLRPQLQELIYAARLGGKGDLKGFAAHQLEERFHRGEYRAIVAELKGRPSVSDADRFWLIRSLIRLQDYQGAAAVVRAMFSEGTAIERVTERMAHLDTFLSYGHAEALADFQALAGHTKDCQECQYLYGVILCNNSSRSLEVIAVFEGLRKAGFCPRLLITMLAMAYEKEDMVLEAIEAYTQLGEDPSAYRRLSLLYLKLGDMEEARRYEELARGGSASE